MKDTIEIVTKNGVTLPIQGKPSSEISDKTKIDKVALIGTDYKGLKPSLSVKEGDEVKIGQVLFTDRRNESIKFTSPAAGKVLKINRGERRILQSIEIAVNGGQEEQVSFKSSVKEIANLSKREVIDSLSDSGLWTSLRMRPYAKIADPNDEPSSIFVTAMDTNPLAPCVETIINQNKQSFVDGISVLEKLTENNVHVCKSPDADIPHGKTLGKTIHHSFDGKHPVGLVGTHIHFIDPVYLNKKVWYIGYQDVVAIGKFFTEGKLFLDRYVALGGGQVKNPRIIKTRLGANVSSLVNGELKEGDNRVISGSVFYGQQTNQSTDSGAFDYLGRYSSIISVIVEDRERVFQGFMLPGEDTFSVQNIFFSKLFPKKLLPFNTSTHGSERDIVPIGSYEKVVPLDVEPTFLLRSLLSKDWDSALALGVLEFDEEEISLCSFVCPAKRDYALLLREALDVIEKEN